MDTRPAPGGHGQARCTPRPAAPTRPTTSYATADEAITAARLAIRGGATLAGRWTYHRADGAEHMIVARYDVASTPPTKQYRPINLADDGRWRIGDPTGPLPLYRLPELLASTADVIYVCEGEKCADAAANIGLVATCSAHGSSAAAKTDWTPLAGRDVVIIPDHDAPGERYVADVSRIVAALDPPARVRIVRLPDLPDGGDIVDWLAERDAQGGDELRGEVEAMADAAPVEAPVDAEHAPEITPVGNLIAGYRELLPPIIDALVRRTETANLVAASKIGKTHLAMQLAVCVATGAAWLDTFRCEAGRVLYVDCELHPQTFARRLAGIAIAMGRTSDALAGRLDAMLMRGRLRDIYGLIGLLLPHAGRYDLIVLDALYRLIPPGVDEDSNSEMTQVYNAVDSMAERMKSTVLIVHHASKGYQGGKSVVDVGAGAGAQSRATDTHIVLRPHETDGVAVVEAACRSWPAPRPMCIRWTYPIWMAAPDCNPADLAQPGRRSRAAADPAEPTAPPEPAWTAERFAVTFLAAEPRAKLAVLAAAEQAGMTGRMARQFLALSEAQGYAHRWRQPKSNSCFFASIPQPSIMEPTP